MRLWGVAALIAANALAASVARADDKQACVDASEQAQKLRDEAKLTKAREQLLACAGDACPAVVRKDCVQWLSQVEASMPTIVPSARDASGKDFEAGKVFVDGQQVADKLDGKAALVDPGPHTIRIEIEGQPTWEQQVVIREGEKNRAITATFATGGGAVAESKGAPVAAFAIGAVGVIALGSFAYFGLTGKNDVSNLRDTCGLTHSCTQDQVDSAKKKLVIADVSLLVGVVALGVATFLFVTHPSSSRSAKPNVAKLLREPPFDARGGFWYR